MTGSQGTGRTASRRAVVAAAGAVGLTTALAACSDPASESTDGNTVGGSGQQAPAEEAPAEENGGGGEAGAGALAKTADIPEGGGKIFEDQKVVVTQPKAGEFKAFSAVCTHQGCTVSEVANGTINCLCHKSAFSVADGSVKGGPAQKPLPPAKVTVQGDSITLG